MKKIRHKVFSTLIIAGFFFYWLINIPLSLFGKNTKHFLGTAYPLADNLFEFKWDFFAWPDTFNHRMYFVLRDKKTKTVTDSLEILEDIANRKKQSAPFNQQENIIDHLLNNTILNIEGTTWHYQAGLRKTMPGKTDSFYQAKSIEMASGNGFCTDQIKTLSNYCTTILPIDTTGKEFKIVIAHESICPFAQRNNLTFTPKKTIYFQTTFLPFEK